MAILKLSFAGCGWHSSGNPIRSFWASGSSSSCSRSSPHRPPWGALLAWTLSPAAPFTECELPASLGRRSPSACKRKMANVPPYEQWTPFWQSVVPTQLGAERAAEQAGGVPRSRPSSASSWSSRFSPSVARQRSRLRTAGAVFSSSAKSLRTPCAVSSSELAWHGFDVAFCARCAGRGAWGEAVRARAA